MDECHRNADGHQAECQRRAIGVSAVFEGAPVDIKRIGRAVVDRATAGDQQDVFIGRHQRKRLIERDEADRSGERRCDDMAKHAPFAGAIHTRRIGQMRGYGADGRCQDDHCEGCADDAVRHDHQKQRKVIAQVESGCTERAEKLVEQAGRGRIGDPYPQHAIKHGRAHARQQPQAAKEIAEPVRYRRRRDGQQRT